VSAGRRSEPLSIGTRATLADRYHVEGKAELVNGEIVPIAPISVDPGFAHRTVVPRLLAYAEQTG
jgi:hypothetical protein